MVTDSKRNLNIQARIAIVILVIGVLLMVFKIIADSEPGAIPLLLILVGIVWYFVTRYKLKSIK